MWFDVSMNDIVVMAVLQRQDDLPDVVAAHRLAVNKSGCGPLDNLETQISTSHELKDHVEHALGTKKKTLIFT